MIVTSSPTASDVFSGCVKVKSSPRSSRDTRLISTVPDEPTCFSVTVSDLWSPRATVPKGRLLGVALRSRSAATVPCVDLHEHPAFPGPASTTAISPSTR